MRGARPGDAPGTGRGADLGMRTGPLAGLRRGRVEPAPTAARLRESEGWRFAAEEGRGGAMARVRGHVCYGWAGVLPVQRYKPLSCEDRDHDELPGAACMTTRHERQWGRGESLIKRRRQTFCHGLATRTAFVYTRLPGYAGRYAGSLMPSSGHAPSGMHAGTYEGRSKKRRQCLRDGVLRSKVVVTCLVTSALSMILCPTSVPTVPGSSQYCVPHISEKAGPVFQFSALVLATAQADVLSAA